MNCYHSGQLKSKKKGFGFCRWSGRCFKGGLCLYFHLFIVEDVWENNCYWENVVQTFISRYWKRDAIAGSRGQKKKLNANTDNKAV